MLKYYQPGKIRMTANGVVANDTVTKKGDTLTVAGDVAERLIEAGKATSCDVRLRVARATLSGTVWRLVGDECKGSANGAVGFHNLGKVVIADGQRLEG